MLIKFLIIFIVSILTFAEEQHISVVQQFNSGHLFNDNVTYNIVIFDYVSKNVTESSLDSQSIKLGIATTENILVDVIWEHQNVSEIDIADNIQSVELKDLNHDGLKDIIINYTDVESEFPDNHISSFLINANGKFQEISETFVKNRYEIIENDHIRHETPLSIFGRPYIDDEPQKNAIYWIDFYEFQNQKLVNINQKYRKFFEQYRSKSEQQLHTLINQIKTYQMSDDSTINQLQLEEYFNEIIDHKTVIHRSEKVLY